MSVDNGSLYKKDAHALLNNIITHGPLGSQDRADVLGERLCGGARVLGAVYGATHDDVVCAGRYGVRRLSALGAHTGGQDLQIPDDPMTSLIAAILSGRVAGAMNPETPHSTPSLAISSACRAVNTLPPGWLISVTA